jgi:anaphase-promoting complex subunit 10
LSEEMRANIRFERTGQRRALQPLDVNSSLLNAPRGKAKRSPITYDKENEDAVLDGIAFGTYSYDEVLALTNYLGPTPPATPNPQLDTDDEEVIGAMDQPGGPSHEPLNERSLDYQGDGDGDDEMLMEDMDEDLGENAAEGQAGEEDDEEDGEPDDHEGAYFDPTSMGLKEISNLAHFGVSSHKLGNGVEELLSDDLEKYWQ